MQRFFSLENPILGSFLISVSKLLGFLASDRDYFYAAFCRDEIYRGGCVTSTSLFVCQWRLSTYVWILSFIAFIFSFSKQTLYEVLLNRYFIAKKHKIGVIFYQIC